MWIHRSTDACKNQLNKSNKIKLVIGFIDHQSFKIKQKYYSQYVSKGCVHIRDGTKDEWKYGLNTYVAININQSNQD